MINFETKPEDYRHWVLTFDGAIATLGLDVDVSGYLIVKRKDRVGHAEYLGCPKRRRLQAKNRLSRVKAQLHQANAIVFRQRVIKARYLALIAGPEGPEGYAHRHLLFVNRKV